MAGILRYLLFRLATVLVRRLPERWGIAIARRLGGVIYRVSPLAEGGRDNAHHVLGPDADPASVSRLTRHAFQYRLLNYYDLLRLSGMPAAEISRRIKIEGTEYIDQVVAEGRGAVVIGPHMGPVELMIQGLASLGYRMIGITEHLEPERFHKFVMGLRSAHGLNLISTQGSLLDVYRRIKRGEILLSTLDRDSTGTGVVVDFLGVPAWMPDGYARIAVRAGVPLVFGFCRRAGDGAGGKIYPPMYPNGSLRKEEAVMDLVQRTVRLFEKVIREYPEEWHLSTPVWRLAQERLEKEASR